MTGKTQKGSQEKTDRQSQTVNHYQSAFKSQYERLCIEQTKNDNKDSDHDNKEGEQEFEAKVSYVRPREVVAGEETT